MKMKIRVVPVAFALVLVACQPASEKEADRAPPAIAPPARDAAKVAELPDVVFDIDLRQRRKADYTNPAGERRWHMVFEYSGAPPAEARTKAILALRNAGYLVKDQADNGVIIFRRNDLKLGSLRVIAGGATGTDAADKGRYIINLPVQATH